MGKDLCCAVICRTETGMSLSQIYQVETTRDIWDWLTIGGGLALFLSGTVTFLYWAAQMRRKPEAQISWGRGSVGFSGPFESWEPGDPVEISEGDKLFVRIIITNVGDASGINALVNIVVPEALELECVSNDLDMESLRSIQSGVRDPFAGEPPDYIVRAAALERLWSVSVSWIIYFSVGAASSEISNQVVRVVCNLNQNDLNRFGRRWLPTLGPSPGQLTRDSPLIEPIKPRSVKAQKHVYRYRGSRIDFREVRLKTRRSEFTVGHLSHWKFASITITQLARSLRGESRRST